MNKKCEITYREMEPEDFSSLVDLQMATWDIEQLLGARLGRKFGELYIEGVISNSTKQIVALNEGKVVGVVMAKYPVSLEMPKPSEEYQKLEDEIKALSTAGAQLIDQFHKIHATYVELAKNSMNVGKYDGYLTFLALDTTLRGAGIGRGLVNCVSTYLKECGANMYFLYTDTTCNYGFYDHLNFSRTGTVNLHIELDEKAMDIDVFIYDYDLTSMI